MEKLLMAYESIQWFNDFETKDGSFLKTLLSPPA